MQVIHITAQIVSGLLIGTLASTIIKSVRNQHGGFYGYYLTYCIENLNKSHRLNYRQWLIKTVAIWIVAIVASILTAYLTQ